MPNLVEQQHIVQDPNPFAILVSNEDIENYDDGAQQFLPDHIKNQGAEDAISAKQNDFDPNQEDRGAPQQVQGAQKYHKIDERGSRLKMYLRDPNWRTNQTATRKNLSRDSNIATKYLPISILLLTKSMAK